MLIRNVGHLMTTPAILTKNNQEIGEGIMDAIITTLIATYDFKKEINKNSEQKSIYIVRLLSLMLFGVGLFFWKELGLSTYYLATFTVFIIMPVGFTAMKINQSLSFKTSADVLKVCTAAGLVVIYLMK